MKDRFPRTAAEFAEHDRTLMLQCECGAITEWLGGQNLVQRFGPDFDLYDGFVEIQATMPCEKCGRKRRLWFSNPNQKRYEPYTAEESLIASLELSAFALARDAAAAAVSPEELLRQRSQRKMGRVRTFGRAGRH